MEESKNSFFRDREGYKRMGHLLAFITVSTSAVVTAIGVLLVFLDQVDTGVTFVSIGLGQGITGGGMEAWSEKNDSDRERMYRTDDEEDLR